MKKAIILAVSYVLIFIVGLYSNYMVSLFDGDWFYESEKYRFPKTIILEKYNKNSNLNAQILFDKEANNYFLAIKGKNDTKAIVTSEFVPSAAYHDPIIELSWLSPTQIKVTVDSDFGDNIRKYIFNIKNYTFYEQSSNKPLQPTAESSG